MKILSDSDGRTRGLGRMLAAVLVPGDVLCLEGALGTGKTVLVQGLAGGLGYPGIVPSPTFTIIHPYRSIRLCHVDAFRLSGPDELESAGIDDYLDGEWICAVEWADRVRAALPGRALYLRILFTGTDERRVIEVEAQGDPSAWGPRLAAVKEIFAVER